MRILFDQGTPAPLRRHLRPHEVDTVAERGWSTLTNGELLRLAEIVEAVSSVASGGYVEVVIE